MTVTTSASGPAAATRLAPSWLDRVSGVSLALAAADVLTAAAVLVAAGHSTDVAAFAVAVVALRLGARLYRVRLRLSFLDDVPRALTSTALASLVGVAAGHWLVPGTDVVPRVGWSAAAFLLATSVLHVLVLSTGRWVRRHWGIGERTLVLGAGHVGVELATTMLEHPEFGLRPVGFLDGAPLGASPPLPVLGTSVADLAGIIEQYGVQTVVMAFSSDREAKLIDAVIEGTRNGTGLLVVPRLYELHHDGPDVERLRGYPLIRFHGDPGRRPTWWAKRGFDLLVAATALAVLSPVLLLAALGVLAEGGRPIIFRQERVGLDGRPFDIYKFRSLRPVDEAESQQTWTIADDPRLGPVGRVLRRTSVDELPQLWNIVRGDMSLVGPRPERPGFAAAFAVEHARYWARHRVPVGLTGLAQVNGLRGDTSIDDRARFDNYYIANWSLWLDVKIILLTVREVFGAGGR
ncbi:exopolysaccharide biosynthesis polyprenyl glycosylphosphotransferase [Klenkia soli]|uniref:Exopolysaccharide biosynthesis polyprenyl glycosylphosphotransferase n=1 Tax=Klenkia soli TaxID=1052260 RepID=A0A1H0J387_9ACTN|nr:sugar transferase [Klenkia soli]SDO37899.1 exopolysaccharide biosynthesis polyprenyl glycosylphosphotransferase [Klenkia soli]